MEDVTKVLCEILKDNKIAVDEVKIRHKLNKLSENRTKNQNTQQKEKQHLEKISKSKPFKTKNKMIKNTKKSQKNN